MFVSADWGSWLHFMRFLPVWVIWCFPPLSGALRCSEFYKCMCLWHVAMWGSRSTQSVLILLPRCCSTGVYYEAKPNRDIRYFFLPPSPSSSQVMVQQNSSSRTHTYVAIEFFIFEQRMMRATDQYVGRLSVMSQVLSSICTTCMNILQSSPSQNLIFYYAA